MLFRLWYTGVICKPRVCFDRPALSGKLNKPNKYKDLIMSSWVRNDGIRSILAAILVMIAVPSLAQDGAHRHIDEGALAFPGAQGWARFTPGGRGGQILRVTTLASEGEGSLRAALETPGPRIVVFEVGGVIDLERQSLVIDEPYVTIAGQTAPSPGITLIGGGLTIRGHDVIVQHLRIRPGSAGGGLMAGWDFDAISVFGGWQVVVDHCSLTWGTDENLSASGRRFVGDTPEAWGEGAAHRVTFSNNIIAEGLANSTHPKGEHSKGSLIHDHVSDLLIVGNLYAHNMERSPLLKGGVSATMVNNFIYDPGQRAVHYNLAAIEWGDQPYVNGRLTAVGNVMRLGPSSDPGLPFLMLGGAGDLDYHGADNIAVDGIGEPVPLIGRYTTGRARIIEHDEPLDWPAGLEALQAGDVEYRVLTHAGARPWDRDEHDVRVLANAAEGRGAIIDDEKDVGGYPEHEETRRPFDPALWDLDTMQPLDPATLDSSSQARGT